MDHESSHISGETGSGLEGFFTGALGSLSTLASELFIKPAIAKAQLPAAQAQLAQQLAVDQAKSQSQMAAISSVILWGGIAFGLVVIVQAFAKKI